MIKAISCVCLIALQLFSVKAWSSEPEKIRYYQALERYQYQVELLQHVLDLTANEYGAAHLEAHLDETSIDEFSLMKRDVDVLFLPTSRNREARFIAVKIPLLQGMLGFRLLLAKPETNRKLSQIERVEAFRNRLIGGAGIYWEDLKILNHNKLLTKVTQHYDQLYPMLETNSIDYLSLGGNEIFVELELKSKRYPNLEINSDVAFYYPFPMYYFVHLSKPELAQRIEVGLHKALSDGSFRQIFNKYYLEAIQHIKELKIQKVFYLENPNSPEHPQMKLDWWLPDLILGSTSGHSVKKVK